MTEARRFLLLSTWTMCVLAAMGAAMGAAIGARHSDRGPGASSVTPLKQDAGGIRARAVSMTSLGLQRLVMDREALDDLRRLGEECGSALVMRLVIDDYLRAVAAEEMRLQAGDGPPAGEDLRRVSEEFRQRTRELWASADALLRDRKEDVGASRRAWARRTWLLQSGDEANATFSWGIDLIGFVKRDFETRVAYRRLRTNPDGEELVELRDLLDEYDRDMEPLIAAFAHDMIDPGSVRDRAAALADHRYRLDRAGRKHAQRVADWIGRRSGSRAALLWRDRFLRASDPAYFGTLTPDERRVMGALVTSHPEREDLPLEVQRLLDERWSVSADLRKLMWREWRAFSRHEEPSDELRASVDALERRLNAAGSSAWRQLCRCSGEGDGPPMRPMWGFWQSAVAAEDPPGALPQPP